MSIKVTSIQFDSTLDNGGYSDFLTGNVGDAVKIKINFYFENTNVATSDNSVIFNPVSTNSIDTDDLIQCENNEFISGLKVGDLLVISSMGVGYDGTYTVTEIIDSNTFRVNDTFANATKTSGNILNTTNNKGLRYYYNFVENGIDFTSLTDPNEINLFTTNVLDYDDTVTILNLNATGGKTAQIGTATIQAIGEDNGRILYEIIHDTIITPLFLANQIDDTQNGIRPSYFKSGSTLNYICQIDLCRNLLDSNNFESIQNNVIGNIGWFNENFNGLESNYYLDGIIYSNTINALDLNVNTEVIISLKCNDTSFTTDTLTRLGFVYLPDNDSDYQENNRLLIDNFCFDTKVNITNNTPSNGSNFGNAKQVIKNCKATLTDTSTITITANIELGSTSKSTISESDFKNYLLFVSVENESLTFESKDRVNVLWDLISFAI